MECLLTINIQRFLCIVIKFQVVNEAIQSSSKSVFITNFFFVCNNALSIQQGNTGTFDRLFNRLFQ